MWFFSLFFYFFFLFFCFWFWSSHHGTRGAPTWVWAKYNNGEEGKAELEGASEADVEFAMRDLVVNGAGASIPSNPSVDYSVEAGQDRLVNDPWQQSEFYSQKH